MRGGERTGPTAAKRADAAEGSRHKVAGELLHAVVQIPCRTVVVAAGHLDFVFQFVEVFLQLQEVFVRLELGIGFSATANRLRRAMERARASIICSNTAFSWEAYA